MFNMSDALMQPESLALLMGTDVVQNASKPVHKKEFLIVDAGLTVTLENAVDTDSDIFVFETQFGYDIGDEVLPAAYTIDGDKITFTGLVEGDRVIVDYYYLAATQSLTIEVDKFAGYYRIEAETLYRREWDGKDLPAIYTMPRVKFASNFTIANAATGDPNLLDVNIEAFPDEFNKMVVIDILED